MDADTDFEDYREQLLYLLQNGLYESAEAVCCFGLSSVRSKKRRAALLEIWADSLFAMSQFKRAARLRKVGTKLLRTKSIKRRKTQSHVI